MWLWHTGPAPLSADELWRAYLARCDEEHAFRFVKGTLGLTATRVRTPEQAGPWLGRGSRRAGRSGPGGDITRAGRAGQLAPRPCPARSPAPDPGRTTAPADRGIARTLALPVMGGSGCQTLMPGPWTRSVEHAQNVGFWAVTVSGRLGVSPGLTGAPGCPPCAMPRRVLAFGNHAGFLPGFAFLAASGDRAGGAESAGPRAWLSLRRPEPGRDR